MSYDVLIIIVVINAVVTMSLWRKVATKSNAGPKLNKKAATALWRSEPIAPKHNPPKVAGGQFPSLASGVDRQFFADFKEFADVLNWWLADEYIASRFRLQDLPDGDLSLNVDFSHGPTLGRSWSIYYNQSRVGRLEIAPSYNYTGEVPGVNSTIRIDWARLLGFGELNSFLDAIAWHVVSADSQSAEYQNARLNKLHALSNTLWDHYQVSEHDEPDDEQWGDLNVVFVGTAFFYIDRRDASARSDSR
jgi:hypothetical protein